MAEDISTKSYLGDAVYVDFDGYAITLTTENGIEATNTIVLEPDVYKALTEYVARLGEPAKTAEPEGDIIDANFEMMEGED